MIRNEILEVFDGEPMTVNEVAHRINSNWLTAKRHLQWLEKHTRKIRVVKKKRGITLYQTWWLRE